MPTTQGGIAQGAASAPGPGSTLKTRAGVAVGVSSAPAGVSDKVYPPGTLPSSSGATAPTGTPAKGWVGHAAVGVTNTFRGIDTPVITDAEFDEAERRDERWPVWNLEVDWTDEGFTGVASDLSATLRSVQVERSITGELPDESGVVDGYATGSMTAEIGGFRDGAILPVAAELSPYRTDSPLFGRTLVTPLARLDLGLLTDAGPKTYRQLTGPIRTLQVSERDQIAYVTAVDPSERIREIITLPTYAEFVTHAKRRNWAITVNTQWIVDHVLRANGIYASPPPRPDAIISCTGHGGLASEIGFNGAPISLPGQVPRPGLWTDDAHPYGMLGSPEPRDASGTVGYQELYGITDGRQPPFRFEAGNGVGVSMLAHLGPWMGFANTVEGRYWQIRPGDIMWNNADNETPRLFLNWYGNGDFYCGLVGTNGQVYATPRIPTTGAERWRHIGVHFRMTSATAMVIAVRSDRTTRTYNLTIPAQVPARGYRPTLQVNPQMTRSWSNLQAWVAYDAPSLAEWQAVENHTPEADIGRGINELLYLPDVAAQDSWEVLKAAIGAEFGVHGFDENGRYFFRPRTDERSPHVDVDVDVESNLSDVGYSISSDSIRNVIGYSTTPRYHSGDLQPVVKAQDVLQFVCDPGITEFELDWPWGAGGRQGGLVPYYWTDSREPLPQPQWQGDVPHGWTYSYGSNWTGEQNIANVGVSYCQIGRRRIRVTVNNTGNVPVRLATDANVADLAGQPGEPALNIGGWPIIDQPDHVEEHRDERSIAKYRSPRALALGSSVWRQTPGVLDPVARALLTAMSEPVSILEDLPVRGNPRVQVGMVARLRFRGDAMRPIVGIIIKTVRDLDGNGYTDRISVRPLPEQSLAPTGYTMYVDTSHHQWNTSQPIDLQRVANVGYAGHVARVGQGAGNLDGGGTNGALIDTAWQTSRAQSRAIWPETFAGYWYVGDTETPAAQASRCLAQLDTETRTIYGPAAPTVETIRTDGPYTLGTKFRLSAHGKVSALRFYRPNTSVGGTIRGCIYPEGSTTPVAGTTVTFTLSGTGWQTATLSSPVTLAPGRYRVGILFPGSFPDTDRYWTSGPGRYGHRNGIVVADPGNSTACWAQGSTLTYPDRVSGPGETWFADAVITSTTPMMLDYEDGGGSWQNLLNVLSAFRAAGIAVTMLYTNLQGYAPSHGATNIDAATGLRLINSRYWISRVTDPAQDPRAVLDDILATNPTFGRGTILGGTVDALQYTDAGLVYPGMAIDVDMMPGDAADLSDMIYNR